MTSAQVRRARHLLGWSVAHLAKQTKLPCQALMLYETTGRMQRSLFQQISAADRLTILRATLESAGVVFTDGQEPRTKMQKAEVVIGAQVREARRLLGWTACQLNGRCSFPDGVVHRFEKSGHIRQAYKTVEIGDRRAVIRAILEAAGVEFIDQNGGGSGVRLRSTSLTHSEL